MAKKKRFRAKPPYKIRGSRTRITRGGVKRLKAPRVGQPPPVIKVPD